MIDTLKNIIFLLSLIDESKIKGVISATITKAGNLLSKPKEINTEYNIKYQADLLFFK